MSRRPNKAAPEARLLVERFGSSQRRELYRRIAAGKSFALFLVDDRLSLADYPSARCSGLMADLPESVVGVYTDMPSIAEVVADLQTMSELQRSACAQANAE